MPYSVLVYYNLEWNVVQLNIQISQGSVATDFRWGERFYLSYSAVYLRIQKWKNYWNRSKFAKVIVKSGTFLKADGVQ